MKTKILNESEIKARKDRGLVIAKQSSITKQNDTSWKVQIQSNLKTSYFVRSNGFGSNCNCPDFKKTNSNGKHIFAVEYIVTERVENGVKIQIIEKKTHTQNLNAYDKGQNQEKELFLDYLNDLVQSIPLKEYYFGRPKIPIRDVLFCLV